MEVQALFGESSPAPSGPLLTITIPGYVPCNRNQLNGCHWMLVLKEGRQMAFDHPKDIMEAIRKLQVVQPSDAPTTASGATP